MPTSQELLDTASGQGPLSDQSNLDRIRAALQRATYSENAPQIGNVPAGSGVVVGPRGFMTAGPVPQSAVANLRVPDLGAMPAPSPEALQEQARDQQIGNLQRALITEGARNNQAALAQIQQALFNLYLPKYAKAADRGTAVALAGVQSGLAMQPRFAEAMKALAPPKRQIARGPGGQLFDVSGQGQGVPITPGTSTAAFVPTTTTVNGIKMVHVSPERWQIVQDRDKPKEVTVGQLQTVQKDLAKQWADEPDPKAKAEILSQIQGIREAIEKKVGIPAGQATPEVTPAKPGILGTRILGTPAMTNWIPGSAAAAAAPKQLTEDLARQLLRQAGGDKAKARQLAREAGYTF